MIDESDAIAWERKKRNAPPALVATHRKREEGVVEVAYVKFEVHAFVGVCSATLALALDPFPRCVEKVVCM